MGLKREDTKTFRIRKGLDHNENPAVEVEIQPDDGDGKVTVVPLPKEAEKWLKEIERKVEEEGNIVVTPATERMKVNDEYGRGQFDEFGPNAVDCLPRVEVSITTDGDPDEDPGETMRMAYADIPYDED